MVQGNFRDTTRWFFEGNTNSPRPEAATNHNATKEYGGERGIRTPGTREGSVVFKTTPFGHSGISPPFTFGFGVLGVRI